MIFTELMLDIIKWTSRILCLIFILFISLFGFDVFGQGVGFWKTAGAFIIHQTPVLIMIAVLAISWKRPLVGGVVFLIIAVSYVIWSAGNGRVYPAIAVPLFVLSILFLLNWLAARNRNPGNEIEKIQ